MTFFTVSTKQIIINSVLVAVLSSGLTEVNSFVRGYYNLPEVYSTKDGACVKVVNYENGHAFNCNDVNVLLRRFRRVTVDQ